MTLYLVRHGETAFNRDGQGLGRKDVPLTERGLAQAEAVAGRFATVKVTRVLSSPLARALTLAGLVAARHQLQPEVMESLTELDIGETDGMSFAEMRGRFPDFLKTWASDENTCIMRRRRRGCPAARASRTSGGESNRWRRNCSGVPWGMWSS